MYQWYEIRKEEKQGEHTVTKYEYDYKWSETPIPSVKFHDHRDHENPTNAWPFASEKILG